MKRLAIVLLLCATPHLAHAQAATGDRLPTPQQRLDLPARPDSRRFGIVPDDAYGAYQRGLYLTAYNLALPKAEAGDSAAQTLVAELLAQGLGQKQNVKAAAEWYRKAAEQGVPEAQFQYALLLLDGTHVPRDRVAAAALMEDSANAGNALAQFNFAQILISGSPVPKEVERAVGYFERAAKIGLPDAQYAMAQIYTQGVGGKKADEAEARRWLERAARQNFDTAQLELGSWLVEGRGGPIKEQEGYAWLRRAAEIGNVAARNRLAKLLVAGIGTEANPVEAAAWYLAARRAGLTDPQMEDFLDGLTEEQLNTARTRAAEIG